jgi:hypothetical protein
MGLSRLDLKLWLSKQHSFDVGSCMKITPPVTDEISDGNEKFMSMQKHAIVLVLCGRTRYASRQWVHAEEE